MEKSPRIKMPPEVRQFVLNRDGGCCRSCGSTQNLEVDHIIPLAKGGTNDLSNLQALCRPCNRRKKHYVDPRFKRRFT
ncbi:HNH endonuclease [Spirulina subsalsa FACHB-351]|uniref:HNH endonuclease n=1 Tax=Spirulina subsalsa FACHB-351 TaxID=234711 RepID=A0ABT3L263_9CYAN|nr:HNH endonuclease [Spirulina subsalsa]MCW6035593.1 HNH endonuclease [Spirulina subsalsa FACHB-351]